VRVEEDRGEGVGSGLEGTSGYCWTRSRSSAFFRRRHSCPLFLLLLTMPAPVLAKRYRLLPLLVLAPICP
jgi:hypothetical protein